MTLSSGTKLSHYEILEPIGAGGMGEVYRARDTKLGREVAIKVLPEAFAQDKGRLARFEREARLLASLNHPNIATLYGLEESNGQKFLVMEMVEGETLAERIAHGAIPVDEALLLFHQIADGLEAAHEKGVIHRDLKPANIKITPEGKPKVLDFGLAKVYRERPSDSNQSESPTFTRGTATGVILGTAPYMSPEQARGTSVDKRADVWAFGCCLYEALTGRPAFRGDTMSDTIAAILKNEPDWDALPSSMPGSMKRLLRRCFQKKPEQRLRDIGDARLEIEDAESAEPDVRHVFSLEGGQVGNVSDWSRDGKRILYVRQEGNADYDIAELARGFRGPVKSTAPNARTRRRPGLFARRPLARLQLEYNGTPRSVRDALRSLQGRKTNIHRRRLGAGMVAQRRRDLLSQRLRHDVRRDTHRTQVIRRKTASTFRGAIFAALSDSVAATL